jgi:CheY-like chemotaxis protein
VLLPGGTSRSNSFTKTVSLCFRVQDTGIGIPLEFQPALFQPYSQAKRSITRSHGGTGLGLAIVKRLSDLMRGEIEIESTVNVGTTFSFTVEFLCSNPPTPIPIVQRRIEDTPVPSPLSVASPHHHSSILSPSGLTLGVEVPIFNAIHSPSGSGGISGGAGGNLKRDFSCDIGAVRRNNFSNLAPSTASSASNVHFIQHSLGLSPLPCDWSEDDKSASPQTATLSNRRHLLIVDDARINRRILEKMLAADYDLTEAENGLEAVASINANPKRYAAVLMDIQMPVMDGRQAVKQMRASGHTLPIIAVTANTCKDDIALCLSMGFTAFLAKPFHKAEMRLLISRLIAEASTRAPSTT